MKNKTVKILSTTQVKELCDVFDLPELKEKIRISPPKNLFRTDGCTGWVDKFRGICHQEACIQHDIAYWSGERGDRIGRLRADIKLLYDVITIRDGWFMALIMFIFVRIFGAYFWRRSFS